MQNSTGYSMRMNYNPSVLVGATMLGLAMAALTLGFALFFMQPEVLARSPQPWLFALLTAVVVTLTSAKPLTRQPVTPPRP